MTNSISENRISQGTQIWLSNWSYLSKIKSRVLCFSLLFTTGFFLSGADRRGKKMEGLLCFCFAAFIILGWSFASLAWRSAKLMSDNFDSFTQRHNRRLLKTTGELSIDCCKSFSYDDYFWESQNYSKRQDRLKTDLQITIAFSGNLILCLVSL